MNANVLERYTFSGNAIIATAEALALRTIEDAAIVKVSDSAFHVEENAPHHGIYAAIDAQTVQELRKQGYFRSYELIKDRLIADAKRRKTERGEPRKKDHHEYSRVSLGSSDIASIILRDSRGVRELRFGEDGTYAAYLVDAECEIPDYYTLEAECKSWLSVYDDDTKTLEVKNPSSVIRVYRAGTYGCIIQLL